MVKIKKIKKSHRSIIIISVLVTTLIFSGQINDFIRSQIKTISFRIFYSNLTKLENQKQWTKHYEFLPNSTKRFISSQQYVEYMNHQANLPISSKFIINHIEVNDNKGKINRTRIDCFNIDCTGENRKENTADKTYVYENGKWKVPEQEPSEKALKIAYFIFTNGTTKEQQNDGIKKWSNFGVINFEYSIHNLALFLDNDPADMVKAENWVENYKANQNRQIVVQRQLMPMPEFNPPKMPITTNCYKTGFGQFAGISCTTY